MITRTKSLRQYVLLFLLFLGATSFATAQNHDLYGLWVKRAAFGSGGSASITTSTVDEQGNVYVAGTFTGTLNFSDDLCAPVMRTAPTTVGHLFLIKYDNQGKYQWDVVVKNGSNILTAAHVSTLEYQNGKILFGTDLYYLVSGTTLPLKSTYQGLLETKTITGPSTADGAPGSPARYAQKSFQVIDANSGALNAGIGDISKGASFVTGTSSIVARMEGDNIFAIHFGFASIYPSASPPGVDGARYSVVSSFKLSDGSINYVNRSYPNQPMSTHPSKCDGSRFQKHITLADHSQILIQYTHDYTDVVGGAGIPAYYLVKYDANFTSKQAEKLLSVREVDANKFPEISSDASNNVYIMMNFGHSKYWNTQVDIANSSTLTNALGSTTTFTTAPQANTIILGRVDPNLAYTAGSWVIQIGSKTSAGMVYGSSLKTVGNYTYITGQFKGTNVPFGNGKTLSSVGDYDGFYAVYNNSDGKCVYAVNMGGIKAENNTTLKITPAGNVIIAGTYNSPLLQTDPSGRLYPISSNGTTSQGFVSLYSTDPLSSPIGKASSYGDAPISYGLAVHYVEPCLTLGTFDPAKIQTEPTQNILANSALNDDALATPLGANGLVDLNSAGFKLNGNKLELTVKAINNTDTPSNPSGETAFAAAWIDFNQNGVFDTNEGVSGVKLSPSDTQVTLVWTNALPMMKHGRTYLRIRLTTDASIDNTQPSGMFFTGDVEDHLLYFNLYELEKSMKLKNRPIDAKAEIGDTILYTLTLKNLLNQQADFKLFDPIPDSTRFTKASNSGTVSNIAMAGKSVPSVVWNFATPDLAAGASATRTFEVVVTGKPVTEPHTINNIAFAVRSTDTINSATATCQTWPVVVSGIKAVRDNVSVLPGQSIHVPFLKNDIRGACANTPLAMVDTIKSTWGHIGSFVVNKVVSPADTSLVYTPAAGKFGIDSLTYYIKCGADSSANKVYLMVHKPLSLNYTACPGASITMGFAPIIGPHSNVVYNWYSEATGGTIITGLNNKNTITVIKGKSAAGVDHDYGTWYVEPVYLGISYPRIEVVLETSSSCGGDIPAGCAEDGTVIFKEDFGGIKLDDPFYRTTPLNVGEIEHLDFMYPVTGGPIEDRGQYSLLKGVHDLNDYYNSNFIEQPMMDHSDNYPLTDTDTVGYYLLAKYGTYNGGSRPQTQFYQKKITDLCGGTKLYFSFWAINYLQAGLKPILDFQILDNNGNVLSIYTTGEIPVGNDWKQYGFSFIVPQGQTSVTAKIMNGNYATTNRDIAVGLDDLEVRFCAPPAVMEPAGRDTLVCDGGEFKFNVKYKDDGTFVTNLADPNEELAYRIEYKQKYDDVWSTLGVDGTIKWTELRDNGVGKTFTSVAAADAGYYRVVIAAIGGLNAVQCRVISDFVNLMVKSKPVAPDVRVQLCPDPTPLKVLNLSSYLHPTDTTSNWKVNWKNVSPIPYTPAVDPTTGNVSLAFASGTHTYHYKLENKCGADSARFYVTTLKGSTIQMPPQRVVVCKDMAHSLHIQQMMGVEARGTIATLGLTAAQKTKHVATINGLPFKGAVLFNGFTAWDDPTIPTFDYHGDDTATKVVFTYTAADDSCLTQKVYTLEVIITENILN